MRRDIFTALEEIIAQEWPQNCPTGKLQESDRIFYDGLGLDSVDAVTLFILIEGRFQISIELESVSIAHFETVGTLVDFLASQQRVPHGLPVSTGGYGNPEK